MKRKSIVFLLTLIISITAIFALPAAAFDIEPESAILIEVDTGQVLFEKDADRQLPPASMTKIMPLLIAMEKLEEGAISLDDEVTISRYAASMGGSQIFLSANTQVSVEKLLKAVTIASGNDASVALGEYIAGTYNNFITMMNDRAEELGMENTNFSNSTGLPDPDNYSTARDVAIMSRELVKYPLILEWGAIWTETIQLPDREAMLVNTNRLINYYPSMDGLKTGYTREAGFNLAATAQKGDTRLISVVLQGDSIEQREDATTRMLDYGFNSFSKRQIATAGEQIHNIPVEESKDKVAIGQVTEPFYVMVQRGQERDISQEVIINEGLIAPIDEGEIIGELVVYKDGNIIASVDVAAAENIERANIFARSWRNLLSFITALFN